MVDYLIGGLVFTWIAATVYFMIKKKRKGESIACAGCAHANNCNTIKKEKC